MRTRRHALEAGLRPAVLVYRRFDERPVIIEAEHHRRLDERLVVILTEPQRRLDGATHDERRTTNDARSPNTRSPIPRSPTCVGRATPAARFTTPPRFTVGDSRSPAPLQHGQVSTPGRVTPPQRPANIDPGVERNIQRNDGRKIAPGAELNIERDPERNIECGAAELSK